MVRFAKLAAPLIAVIATPLSATPLSRELSAPNAALEVLDVARQAASELPPLNGIASGQDDFGAAGIFRKSVWESLPVPDDATLAWLKSRVPDLDLPKVRVVSPELAEDAIGKAVAAGANYLDVLSHEGLRQDMLFLVQRAGLAAVDRKYAPGTLPLSGSDSDEKPFALEAFVAGQSRVEFLYGRGGFQFEDAGRSYRLDKSGRVACRILGPGDVSLSGLKVHAVLWKYATIQRMTRIGPTRVRVETDMGSGEGDIRPIRAK